MSLVEGDSITTEKDSSALLYIDDDKEVKIGDNSMVNLSELSGYIGADEQKTGISLWVGKIFSNIKKKLKLRSKYEIKVPTAVMGVRGTEFYVLSLANGEFEVAVLEGTVVGIRNLTQDEENYNTYEVTITKNQMASMNQNDKTQSDTIITEIKIKEATLFALEVLKDFMDRNPESVDENTKKEINNEIEKRRSGQPAIGTNTETDSEKPVIKMDHVVEENMSLNNVMTLANSEGLNAQTEGQQEAQVVQGNLNGAAGTEVTAPTPQEIPQQPQGQVPTQPETEKPTADQGTNPQENKRPVPDPANEQAPPAQEPTKTRTEESTEDTSVSGSGGGGGGSRQTKPQQELPQVQPTVIPTPQASSGWVSNVTKTGMEHSIISFTAQDFNSQLTNIESNRLSGIKIKSLPSNGTLMINGSPVVVNQEIRVTDLSKLIFMPAENWSGTTSFNWVGSSGISYEQNESTVTVTVTPGVNVTTQPAVNIVKDINLTTLEDTEISGKLTADGGNTNGTLIYSVVSHPQHGELGMDDDGSYRYIPNHNYNGSDSFTFKVNDGVSDSNEATANIIITPVNDAPIVEDCSIVLNYTSMAAVTIPASDPEGDTLSYSIVKQPVYGTATLINSATGEFEYTIQQQFNGTDSFVVEVSDGKGGITTSTVTVMQQQVPPPQNIEPIAQNQSQAIWKDTGIQGLLLATDDNPNTSLTYTATSQPANGTLTVNSNGSYIYTPNANYIGTDSFKFKANDGLLDSNEATVTIMVIADLQSLKSNLDSEILDAQVWASKTVGNNGGECSSSTAMDQLNAAIINGQNVQSNSSATIDEISGAINTLKNSVEQVKNNMVNTLMAYPSPVYTNPNFDFHEIISIKPNMGNFVSNFSSSNITLGGDFEGLTILATPLFGYDHRGANVELSGNLSHNTGTGTITINANSLENVANSKDMTAEVVVIRTGNNAPTVPDYSAQTEYNTMTSGTIVASDPDVGDTLSYAVTTSAGYGTATVDSATGAWQYTPNSSYSGIDSFVVTVSDGKGGSATSTVTVEVMPMQGPVNNPPIAQNGSITTSQNTPISAGHVTATDADLDTITYTLISPPAHGTTTLNSDGTYSYQPDQNYIGPDSFTFKANDGKADSNEATINISVAL